MRATTYDGSTDWLEFDDPVDEEQVWNIHVGFLMSNWECLYGRGCIGPVGKEDEHTHPEMGCCAHGAYLNTRTEVKRIQKQVDKFTEEDLGPRGLAFIRKNGWLNIFNEHPDSVDPDEINSKTKVREGGCVFINRPDDGDGKIGCAFLHQAARLQKTTIDKINHVECFPDVCWQLPLAQGHQRLENGQLMTTIFPWDSDYWGQADEDGTHDSWLQWWCTDSPDAYIGKGYLYLRMENELREIMGDPGYEMLRDILNDRKYNQISPMPGAVRNEGRPLLPVIVNGRTPQRVAKPIG